MLQYKLVARINNKEFKVQEGNISFLLSIVSQTLIISGGRGDKGLNKGEGAGLLGGEGKSLNHSTFQNSESQNQRLSCQRNLVSIFLILVKEQRIQFKCFH